MRTPPAGADRVAAYDNRHAPHILDASGLLDEEAVLAQGGQEHKELPEAKVLNACLTCLFPSCPGPLRDVDVVTANELLIDRPGVLIGRDEASDIKPVTAAHVTDRKLLDKSLNRCRFAVIIAHK